MSNTKGWGIEEEKTEYWLDCQLAAGGLTVAQAKQILPGYEPILDNCCLILEPDGRVRDEGGRKTSG